MLSTMQAEKEDVGFGIHCGHVFVRHLTAGLKNQDFWYTGGFQAPEKNPGCGFRVRGCQRAWAVTGTYGGRLVAATLP